MVQIVPIILAGGQGKRLWPLSTQTCPKQFHALINEYSLLQNTLLRLTHFSTWETPIIITHERYRFLVAEQIQQLNQTATILLEKQSHNTTAAITLATRYALSHYQDPMMLILPCDHIIEDLNGFFQMVEAGVTAADKGKLVTFGVTPTYPATIYGYIRKGKFLSQINAFEVQTFVEKPQETLAMSYFKSQEYFWNSGIFLFYATHLLQELQQHAPEINTACQKAMATIETTRDFIYINDSLENCPFLPIDRTIFEHTQDAVVFAFQGKWQDLGTWDALYAISPKDPFGNVIHGKNIYNESTTNSYLFSTKPILYTSGLNHCCIIATEDTILVADLRHYHPSISPSNTDDKNPT
ncbi:MAG TPA: sugar phosphate nucleotidyltransferase [Legionellaceae bacterium]|nr:sugar phosphate nucleotidyltransferase [Legionellaceae bacterium]